MLLKGTKLGLGILFIIVLFANFQETQAVNLEVGGSGITEDIGDARNIENIENIEKIEAINKKEVIEEAIKDKEIIDLKKLDLATRILKGKKNDSKSAIKELPISENLAIESISGLVTTKDKDFKSDVLTNSSSAKERSSGSIDSKINTVIAAGKSKIGTPYSYGSIGPNRFDCSGFVSYIMKEAGVNLPRTSASMSQTGVEIQKSQLRKGDLVFFKTSGKKRINHVGVYIGNGQFIHSSSSKKRGVVISELNQGYYSKSFAMARRVIGLQTSR